MYTSQEISDILDYAEYHGIEVSASGAHASEQTPQVARTLTMLRKIAKENKPLLQAMILKRQTPESPLMEVGHGIESAVKSMIPSTGGGKGAMLTAGALGLMNPEVSIPALIGAGVAGGVIGNIGQSGTTGQESLPKDVAQGAGVGALTGLSEGAFSAIGKGAKYAKAFMQRPHQLDLKMMSSIGRTVSDYLKPFIPKSASRIISSVGDFDTPGKSTVIRVLNSPETRQEVEESYRKTQAAIVDQAEAAMKRKAADAQAAFKKQYPAGAAGAGLTGGNAQFMQAARAVKSASDDAKSVRPQLLKAFNDIHTFRRGAFSARGDANMSISAWKARQEAIPKLEQFVKDTLKDADPSGDLNNAYENLNDNYAKFKGFQDFVNTKNALTSDNKWFQADVLQKAIDPQTNPAVKNIQRRLKDAFDPLRQTVRRNAPEMQSGEPVIADQPPTDLFKRLHMGENVGRFGRIYANIPGAETATRGFTKYIGNAPVERAAMGKAGTALPVLLNAPAVKGEEAIVGE